MSSGYYFSKLRETLKRLQQLANLDLEYQETRAHEKSSCLAAKRLSSVLGQYINIYNDILDCLKQNLQVQKTTYIEAITKAVLARIVELNHELRKLEASVYHYFGHDLVMHRLTTFDVELNELPACAQRPEHIQKAIHDMLSKIDDKADKQIEQEVEEESVKNVLLWWEDGFEEISTETIFSDQQQTVDVVMSEETIMRLQLLNLIKSHEKSRQIVQRTIQSRQRRDRWTKELQGLTKPPAPYAIRERAAGLIQRVVRAYFETKRLKCQEIRRDEILDIIAPRKPNVDALENVKMLKLRRYQLRNKYEKEWKEYYENIKQQFLKNRSEQLAEDYRDFIRSWFEQWFADLKFFYDIPEEQKGGTLLILKEEVPSPQEWFQEYEEQLIKMQSNKGKSTHQIKYEKQEAKREKLKLKKEALLSKKFEANLLKKMMKNPNMHPGYNYPESKKTDNILKVLDDYYANWNDLDTWDILGVKEKYVKTFDYEQACAEAKLEILKTVNDDMRNELNILKNALKLDYERNYEDMLEPMKKPKKRQKRKLKLKTTLSEHVIDRMEYLTTHGYVKNCDNITIEEFLGDPNFAGDDLRCLCEQAYPQNGEIRHVWWNICRKVVHGFNRVLLIGPRGSGKTKLINILASINDAVLFEIDPSKIPEELTTAVFLQELVNMIASCAKKVQPSVIHIKHVHRLFYLKVPSDELGMNYELLNNYFVQKLWRKFRRSDKVTIIGSCVDPWLAKSAQMVKKFPDVILVPNTTYSIIVQFLKTWVSRHTTIPRDLDVNSLAYVLQGYPYGCLEKVLAAFLSPERTIQIAIRGLTAMDVFNFFIENATESKVDYAKYRKWYEEMTSCGRKEKKNLQNQRDFKLLVAQFEGKIKKKREAVTRLEKETQRGET